MIDEPATTSPASPEPPLDALTVTVLTFNNARTIERTMRVSKSLTDRILVVDSGSTDGTQEIVRAHGGEIIERPWPGYIAQKQFALEQVQTPWMLSLDSDESPESDLAASIREAVRQDDASVAGYDVNRRVWWAGKPLVHTWQPEWRTRLVRPERAQWAGYDPHDRLDVDGKTQRLRGNLRHDAFDGVADLIRKQLSHGLVAGQSYYEMNKRVSLTNLLISPPAAVIKQLVLRGGWRDGWRGWLGAFGTGVQATVKHMRLIELAHDNGSNDVDDHGETAGS